jgi:hypothetical protein
MRKLPDALGFPRAQLQSEFGISKPNVSLWDMSRSSMRPAWASRSQQ